MFRSSIYRLLFGRRVLATMAPYDCAENRTETAWNVGGIVGLTVGRFGRGLPGTFEKTISDGDVRSNCVRFCRLRQKLRHMHDNTYAYADTPMNTIGSRGKPTGVARETRTRTTAVRRGVFFRNKPRERRRLPGFAAAFERYRKFAVLAGRVYAPFPSITQNFRCL